MIAYTRWAPVVPQSTVIPSVSHIVTVLVHWDMLQVSEAPAPPDVGERAAAAHLAGAGRAASSLPFGHEPHGAAGELLGMAWCEGPVVLSSPFMSIHLVMSLHEGRPASISMLSSC